MRPYSGWERSLLQEHSVVLGYLTEVRVQSITQKLSIPPTGKFQG